MEWRAEYSVGIEEIDSHHKKLLELFSRIEATISAGLGWSEIHYGIIEIRQFAQFHFAFEEALMRLYGYANAELHSDEHRRVLDRVAGIEKYSLQTDCKEGLLRFFREWLIDHMQGADRLYASHILDGARVRMPTGFLHQRRSAALTKQTI